MGTPTNGSPVVDQLLAAIDHTEQRPGPWPEKTDILTGFYVDLDAPLSEVVRLAADTPMTHRWIDGDVTEMRPTDVRGYVRWVARPHVGVEMGNGWQDHVIAARIAAPPRLARNCDRCGGDSGEILLTLALTPPNLVVIALDSTCVDELDVREFTFRPR